MLEALLNANVVSGTIGGYCCTEYPSVISKHYQRVNATNALGITCDGAQRFC